MKPIIGLMISALLIAQHGNQDHFKRRPPGGGGGGNGSGLSLAAASWTLWGSSRITGTHPMALSPQGWQLIFPQYDDSVVPCYRSRSCQWVGYSDTPYTLPIAAGATFQAVVTITGNAPTFGFSTEEFNRPSHGCSTPAKMRFYLETSNYSGRWWSNTVALPLAVTAPADPSQWSDVNGRFGTDPSASPTFAASLTSPGRVGLTFGGGCYFAHGVYQTNGSAAGVSTFQLLDYHIQ
jgi:hypothetical protein